MRIKGDRWSKPYEFKHFFVHCLRYLSLCCSLLLISNSVHMWGLTDSCGQLVGTRKSHEHRPQIHVTIALWGEVCTPSVIFCSTKETSGEPRETAEIVGWKPGKKFSVTIRTGSHSIVPTKVTCFEKGKVAEKNPLDQHFLTFVPCCTTLHRPPVESTIESNFQQLPPPVISGLGRQMKYNNHR